MENELKQLKRWTEREWKSAMVDLMLHMVQEGQGNINMVFFKDDADVPTITINIQMEVEEDG